MLQEKKHLLQTSPFLTSSKLCTISIIFCASSVVKGGRGGGGWRAGAIAQNELYTTFMSFVCHFYMKIEKNDDQMTTLCCHFWEKWRLHVVVMRKMTTSYRRHEKNDDFMSSSWEKWWLHVDQNEEWEKHYVFSTFETAFFALEWTK